MNFDEVFEKLGEPEVARLVVSGEYANSVFLNPAEAWLALKTRERILADESRSEESLLISNKALRNSELATRIAIAAIILSTIMAIQKVIEWSSR